MIKYYKKGSCICKMNFDDNSCVIIYSNFLDKSNMQIPVNMRSHEKHLEASFEEISEDIFNKFDKLVSYKDEM